VRLREDAGEVAGPGGSRLDDDHLVVVVDEAVPEGRQVERCDRGGEQHSGEPVVHPRVLAGAQHIGAIALCVARSWEKEFSHE
jgi:hypothetical protein